MALYTFFVFGPLALAQWSSRRQRNFWIGASLLIAAHGLVLYIIRSIFPFRSVLVIIPIALIEACALYFIMLKMIGDGDGSADAKS
jgi:cellulose synthase/poly-beta-1,6-N-acetylglucosamine synthase-like glycosyltransferase